MKRKRTITIEFEREVLVEKRARTVQVQCAACGAETDVTVPHTAHGEKSFVRQLVYEALADKL